METEKKYALLIDADNVSPKYMDLVLRETKTLGAVSYTHLLNILIVCYRKKRHAGDVIFSILRMSFLLYRKYRLSHRTKALRAKMHSSRRSTLLFVTDIMNIAFIVV